MNDPQSEQVARLANLFDAVAASYDAVEVAFFGPIADELVFRLAPIPGERALDIGCGTGQVVRRLAEAVGVAGRVVGIDLSPAMVHEARAKMAAAGLADVDFRVMDARDPDLPEGSFDVIAASLVLFFLPDPAAALRAWSRLLTGSGRAGITTFAARDPRWEEVDSVFDPYLPPAMLDARTSGAGGPFATDEGIAGLFTEAGFEAVQTWQTEVDVVFDDVAHWHRWTMSIGQRAMWHAVPVERHPEVLGQAAERLRECVAADGRIHVWQNVRTTVGSRTPGESGTVTA